MKSEIGNIPYLSPYITETQSFVSSTYSQNRKQFPASVHKDDDIHGNSMKAVTAEKVGKPQELIVEVFIVGGQ